MEYGLDHFRASDCQNYQGQFATWKGNDAKRIALWCKVIGHHEFHALQKHDGD